MDDYNSPPNNRIAFFGPMCSGKTYLANDLVDNYGFVKIAFADELKSLAKRLFHVEGKNGPAREVYQKLGESLREIDENVWVNVLLDGIADLEEVYGDDVPIVIDDLRYSNEAVALHREGFLLVKVTTPEPVRLERIKTLYPDTSAKTMSHKSETDLLLLQGDYSVDSTNDFALEDLETIIWEPR